MVEDGVHPDARGERELPMPEIEESIEIARPCAEVFEYATDPEHFTIYQSNVVEYAQETPGERDKGARDKGTVRVAGKKIHFTQEVAEFDPPRRAVMRSLEAPMSWELEMRFDELGPSRTQVTIHQVTGELGGFFGKLGDAMAVKMYQRDVRSNLENLKLLLES
jgi:uncharacterized protein YndB with AHSA1/START domain